MSEPADVTCRVTITTGKRAWGIEPIWTGWRRFLGFGLVVNVLAPALTVFAFGWVVRAGRLVVQTEFPGVEEWIVPAAETPEDGG